MKIFIWSSDDEFCTNTLAVDFLVSLEFVIPEEDVRGSLVLVWSLGNCVDKVTT